MTADVRRSPAGPPAVRTDGPGGGVGDVLALVDDLAELTRAGHVLARRLEAVSGLRSGELQALEAVAAGADHPRAVARRTGQVDRAAAATVEALVRRGLLARHRHPAAPDPGAPPALVHLTRAGRVALAQAEGLQIRALTAVVRELGDRRAAGLRSTVHALGAALSVDAGRAGADRAGGDPAGACREHPGEHRPGG